MSNENHNAVSGIGKTIAPGNSAGDFIETAFTPDEAARAVAFEQAHGKRDEVCAFLGVAVGGGEKN